MHDNHLTTAQILKTLVGFQSVSDQSNLPLLDWVETYATGLGASCRRTLDADGRKGNLLISTGPLDVPGVVLSGHTDVVPTTGQNWSHDPFDLWEADGKYYGRGTCDMKGFLAVALAKLPHMISAPLVKPVHIALSYDEEVGCTGILDLLEDFANLPTLPELVIVGEPTSMQPIVAHKSRLSMEVQVIGSECHASLAPQGVNAVEYAAEMVAFIKSLARRERDLGARDELFDVPHTTLHAGILRGGVALNVVANACEAAFEIRTLPEQDPHDYLHQIQDYVRTRLEPEMKAVNPDCGFEWRIQSDAPGFETDPQHDGVKLVQSLTGNASFAKVAYSTEAGRYQARWGLPCVVCGPGDIAQAHKPDEFISIKQIQECEDFIDRLIAAMSAP